ncbi:MAG: glutamate formimidoyltransferase [Desulfohalobiaceae bacterium]|nr:glutamate formimidoyltransferase [Desulfohalobiaceae bacterium]
MQTIIECVPNFSEGRNQETIQAIAEAIRQTPGCTLLDVDPGASTNRTVYTFVGGPDSVVEGALNAAKAARERIDMRRHSGEHPRMGAMDVCPFIPVANAGMDDCVRIAETFAERAAKELGIPLFLYEAAAREDHRRTLPQIREGEYEGLAEKLQDPAWKPDFGPAEFVPAWGATATGARFFLIAYNVNILGTANQAHRIALNLREAGRGPQEPGRFKEVKGMGWYVDEYNLAQVTVNLTNFRVTPMHLFSEAVKEEAAGLGVGVAGSEVVGLLPLEAVLQAAEYYIQQEGLFILDEDQKVRLVQERLGLNAVAPFKPEEKIIEYLVAEPETAPLAGMDLQHFIQEVAARSSAPGGGSVSAALAALGAGLGAMAAKLTWGVRKFEHLDQDMRRIIPPLHETAQALIPLIDADTNAFEDYMAALRLPKETAAERQQRDEALQAGLKTAVSVPLETMRLGDQAWEALREVARLGNIASKSDIQVGAKALEAGIWGAFQNVRINLEQIKDPDFRTETLDQAWAITRRAEDHCAAILEILEQRG